jgi:hypothetical protein
VSIFNRDVKRIATTCRCERNCPPLVRGVPPTTSNFIWCNGLLERLNTFEEVLKIGVPENFTDPELKASLVDMMEVKTDVSRTMRTKIEEWASGDP